MAPALSEKLINEPEELAWIKRRSMFCFYQLAEDSIDFLLALAGETDLGVENSLNPVSLKTTRA